MSSTLHCAFEELIEYRPSATVSWMPATLTTVLESHSDGTSNKLIVNVVDADGATVLFSAPISTPMAAQCDAEKLDDERRVNVFDESNDHEAQLRFASRHVGIAFVQSLAAGMFRVAGCVAPLVFVINEQAVRRQQGIENAAAQMYSVHLEVQRAGLFDAWTTAPKGDLVVDANIGGSAETKGSVSVGGSPQLASVTPEEDAVQAVLLRAKEHLCFVVALDPAQLTSATVHAWLPDALRDALHADCDKICAVVVKVEYMEVSEDAKKDSIKRRLQRQGAQSVGSGTTPLMKPLRPVSMTMSNDSFGVDRGGRGSSGPQPRPADVAAPPAPDTTKQAKPAAKAQRLEEEARQTVAAPEEQGEVEAPVKKKKSKKQVPYTDDTTDVAEETAAVVAAPSSKRSKGSRAAAEVEVQDVPAEQAAAPPGSPVAALVDYAQMVELQVKLDKKKQRLLKFEAEVLLSMEAAERQRQVNEEAMAEVVALRTAVDTERQHMVHQQQQHEATMRMLRDEDEGRGGSRGRDVGGSATKRGGVRAVGIVGSPSTGKGEREPLVNSFPSSSPAYHQNVQGPEATFSLRLDHPFYDNSSLPPSVERCYPATALFLQAMHHVAGTVVLFAMLGVGIGLVSWSVAEHSDSCAKLWPLCALYAMACVMQLMTLRHKTLLYDGLHRLDQSCSQFDHVVFLYQRKALFLVHPLSVVTVALASLVVLLATSIPVLAQVGVIVGTAGATLAFGSFSLFLMLVTSVAWDRVCATVPIDAGTLCSRLAIRRVAAHYQFVKSLVAGVSREWSVDIVVVLVALFAIMFYCVYAAIERYSFSALLIYNAVFAWAAAFSFVVLRAVSGWQRATLATIGTVAVHCDRWARGDYNSEGDLRLEDYVALQQSLFFATQGSSYAKWTLRLFDDDSTLGRVWLWVCGTLTLASLVLIPVTVLYHIDSWDA